MTKPFLEVGAVFVKSFLLFLLIVSQDVMAGGFPGCSDQIVYTDQYGAAGDGITDDTVALQEALTYCSVNNLTCKIRENVNHLVRGVIFMWGDACLKGPGAISFDKDYMDEPYLFNIGISGKSNGEATDNHAEAPFRGEIKHVTFNVVDTLPDVDNNFLKRILYFWRTDGAIIHDNHFEVGPYRYSSMSSGDNSQWLTGLVNYIRKNIQIINNTVNATPTQGGSEGIGLGWFKGALIAGNKVNGVGDDPVAIHWCENVEILNNDLSSVHGRLYASNSVDVKIAYNRHVRVPDSDGIFHNGIALLWTGFETTHPLSAERAPTNHYIHHNELVYSTGAIDQGAAISMRSARNFIVEYNYIQNDSTTLNGANAIHIWPSESFYVKNGEEIIPYVWSDKDGRDTIEGSWYGAGYVARVHEMSISRNTSTGKLPLPIVMTGLCAHYNNPSENITLTQNIASGYSLECGVSTQNNHLILPSN